MAIKYNIPLKTQTSSSNCVQTTTSQFLSFYDIDISPEEIEKAIPVRINSEGKPIGTLLADIGAWFIESYKLKVTMYVFDAQIIDRTWTSLPQSELLTQMVKIKEEGISTALTPLASVLIEAYLNFLKAGGQIEVTKCTNHLLQTLLDKGPVIAIISFNYMYDYPRLSYDKSIKNYVADTIDGKVVEHAILLTGFDDGKYYYNDPDAEKGGQHEVDEDILIGAICTAQINSDNYLLSIEKP